MNARLAEGNLRRLPASVRTGLALAVVAGLSALAVTSGAASARPASAARTGIAASTPTCALGNGVSHVINIVFDNVHFCAGQPERAVRPRADAAPAELPEEQRHGVLEHAHAADRAHRRRQPDDLHRPVRRPARPAGDEHATRPTTRTGRPTRRPRSRTGRRRSSTPRPRPTRRAIDTTPSMVYSDHVPATTGDTGQDHAGAVGAVHPRRLHGRRLLDREHGAGERRPSTSRPCSAPTRPRSTQTTPTRTRSRTSRSPTTSARPSTAPRATRSARRAGGEVRPDDAVADGARLLPTEPGGYNGYQALFGAKYIAPAIGGGTPNVDPQRLPGHGRDTATSSTSTATRSASRSATARASPGSARPPRSRSPCWPTCRRPASR